MLEEVKEVFTTNRSGKSEAKNQVFPDELGADNLLSPVWGSVGQKMPKRRGFKEFRSLRQVVVVAAADPREIQVNPAVNSISLTPIGFNSCCFISIFCFLPTNLPCCYNWRY